MLKLALAGALALACVTVTHARDNGQWEGVDQKTRQWFKSVRSPSGVPCCDIADGHRTTWRSSKDGGYEALIEGEWISVPPETIVRDAENPTGEAIIWFSTDISGRRYVRCFVPDGGV